jgi:hypothetical protein
MQSTGFELKYFANPSLKSLFNTPNLILIGRNSKVLCCMFVAVGTWLVSNSRLAFNSNDGIV